MHLVVLYMDQILNILSEDQKTNKPLNFTATKISNEMMAYSQQYL